MDSKKRRENEREYPFWKPSDSGGRIYWKEIPAKRKGGKARYVKEVDKHETTILFLQEIYDREGTLIETHQKYPEDLGHKKV